MSDYYTKSQVDASQRTQDNKIVAAENRLTGAENKIVAAENNITGLETSVQELQNTVGQPSIYTRGRVKKNYILKLEELVTQLILYQLLLLLNIILIL